MRRDPHAKPTARNEACLNHLWRVAYPALVLAPRNFVEEIDARLAAAGVQDAIARHDSGAICDTILPLLALQGISDAVALGWDARHGGVTWAEIDADLRARPSCPRLQSFSRFRSCGYRKGSGTCAEPHHQPGCPLPRHRWRKGGLGVASYSLALFVRDICGGDIVAWLDASLAQADPGHGSRGRAATLGRAVLGPLSAVQGIGPKLWSMILGELLLAGDPARERWVAAGAGMIAVDSLVHAFLHRSGTLSRCGAEHVYGPACYAPRGCADILRRLAETVDARQFNPAFPSCFPRFVQHAIWRFCATGGLDICNGRRIDDRDRCRQRHCPAFAYCDRVTLHPTMTGGAKRDPGQSTVDLPGSK